MPHATTNPAVPSPTMAERGFKLTIMVSEAERDMLRALADRDGVSSSDFVRQHVRRAYREAFPEAPATAPKRRAPAKGEK